MNFLNFNPFEFNTYQKAPKNIESKPRSIYSDKTFVQKRTLLGTEIEKTVLKKLKEREGSPFEITDTAAIRDIARNKQIQLIDALDSFLITLIKQNLDCIKTTLTTQHSDTILISQAIDLAETLLNESALHTEEYRDALLSRLNNNH